MRGKEILSYRFELAVLCTDRTMKRVFLTDRSLAMIAKDILWRLSGREILKISIVEGAISFAGNNGGIISNLIFRPPQDMTTLQATDLTHKLLGLLKHSNSFLPSCFA